MATLRRMGKVMARGLDATQVAGLHSL